MAQIKKQDKLNVRPETYDQIRFISKISGQSMTQLLAEIFDGIFSLSCTYSSLNLSYDYCLTEQRLIIRVEGKNNLISGEQKITKSSFNEIWIYKGDSTISYNTIGRIIIRDGAPSISYNDISGGFTVDDGSPSINDNTIHKGININGGSPVISNNKIFGTVNAAAANGKQISISDNELTSIRVHGMHAEISGNKIIGNGTDAGIDVSDSWVYPTSASISANQIYGCTRGIIATVDIQVTKNVIFDNEIGLNLWSSATVQDNTIVSQGEDILEGGVAVVRSKLF